jgi:hypothetical protein
MPIPVVFDPDIGRQCVKYARLVAARGYVHNTLGNVTTGATQVSHEEAAE